MGVYRGDGSYSFSGLRGVSDILGILPQRCACALQGVFMAIEVKKPKADGGREPTNEQKAFLSRIEKNGGVSMVVHSVEELKEELDQYLI